MATATYRYAGSEPESFGFIPNQGGFLSVELHPGYVFDADDGFAHPRVEKKARNGRWTPTVQSNTAPVYVHPLSGEPVAEPVVATAYTDFADEMDPNSFLRGGDVPDSTTVVEDTDVVVDPPQDEED